jgi:26S proteasome regulatory subunit N2
MLNTATTYLALLQESDLDIKSLALDKLELLVDEYWTEISDFISELESLQKSNMIPNKNEQLSLILSKIYYNLEDYDSAIDWSLEAGSKFNIRENSQYVNIILQKIIEKYISIRKNNFFNEEKVQIDERINKIVQNIFTKCLEKREVNQAIGFSLESYDLERVRQKNKFFFLHIIVGPSN